ncbi:ATP-dependent DNA helicase RecG [Parenemella sanctibonifatiensis]|uniref:ATP-dependent DNA helicase RecG n=1 Tax=Parenemella sanctibonifatiensis TaxID=2016505 RepID=A0A255EPI4_9ACTN|nr:ATP-dependent DNA helicase RecG [Parenemella sanctibonifatiensis]OYN91372.1 ATP-dependent DNA helicase RecG [Parenemella sanctibonifatiensis]
MAGDQWRTQIFAELNRPVVRVVGDKTAKQLEKLRISTVGELVRHLPRRYLSGTETSDLSQLIVGEDVAVMAVVAKVDILGYEPRQRLELVLSDGQGQLRVTFFGKPYHIKYWSTLLKPGARGIFAGKVGAFRDQPQLSHPDFVIVDEQGNVIGGAERNMTMARMSQTGYIGMYPATAKLPTWRVAECIQLALDQISGGDPWPDWLIERAELMGLPQALRQVHQPTDRATAEAAAERIRYDEAFGVQLAMQVRRQRARATAAVPRTPVADGLLAAVDAALPYQLTEGQRRVGADISSDLQQQVPMHRLLQGEVGSGKTVVALRAMAQVVDAGGQAVLLAPTEVLAGQHLRSLEALLGDLAAGGTLTAAPHATRIGYLSGAVSAAQRRQVHDEIASGEIGIVVGTHAVLSGVEFADLGLVVIDEQHRFGVEQRTALQGSQGRRPHTLVMTATPIPRTIAMSVFGDLDVSSLTEVPAGRAEVATHVIPTLTTDWLPTAWQRIREAAEAGRQAFVVVPRIEGEDGVEAVAADLAAGPLEGLRLEVLHGRLPTEDKDRIMRSFAAGDTDLLVATTVIEVGVDVPNASVMVIMDADRFGISQLHQLRGRIGRGQHPGLCLLVTGVEGDTLAAQRLAQVASLHDGFALADVDLQFRREGDVLGSAQSGRSAGLRLVSPLVDVDLILRARDDAVEALRADPDLTTDGFADAVAQVEKIAGDEWWNE